MNLRPFFLLLLLLPLLPACSSIPARRSILPSEAKGLSLAERQAIYEDRKVSIQAWFPFVDIAWMGWAFKGMFGGSPVCVGKDCRIGSFELRNYFLENGCPQAASKMAASDYAVGYSGWSYFGPVIAASLIWRNGWLSNEVFNIGLGVVASGLAMAPVNDFYLLPRATWSFNRCLREQLGLTEPLTVPEAAAKHARHQPKPFFLFGITEGMPGGLFPTAGFYSRDYGLRASAGGLAWGNSHASAGELSLSRRLLSGGRQRFSARVMGGYWQKSDEGSGGHMGIGLEHLFGWGIVDLGAVYLPWKGAGGSLDGMFHLGIVKW